MAERYVKVEFTRDECDAMHELCDLANVMLNDLAHSIPKKTRDKLRVNLNSVRYKTGIAGTLFGVSQNIITGTTVDALSLELAKRQRKPS